MLHLGPLGLWGVLERGEGAQERRGREVRDGSCRLEDGFRARGLRGLVLDNASVSSEGRLGNV